MIFNISDFKYSILKVIKTYVNLKKRGLNNYFGICPFHFEKTASFSVNLNQNYFYCFGCKEKGDVIDFLIKYKKFNFIQSINFIKKKEFKNDVIINVDKIYKINKIEKKTLYDLNNKIKEFYFKKLNFSNKAKKYLYSRGCNKKLIKIFKIGYCSYNSNLYYTINNFDEKILNSIGIFKKNNFYKLFPGRIIFPIFNINNRIVGFAGRNLNSKNPKYLNSKNNSLFTKNKNFYGIWLSKNFIIKKNFVLIVEGYFDVITLFKNKFKNVLGLMGSNFTIYHLKNIFKLCNNIFFCLDSDLAGVFSIKKILKIFLINNFFYQNVRFVILPKGYDPDSFIRKFGYKYFLIKFKMSNNFKKTFYNIYIKDIFLEKKNIYKNFLEIKFIINKINFYKDKLIFFYLISDNKNFRLKHFFFIIDDKKKYFFDLNQYFYKKNFFEEKVLFFLLIHPEVFFFIEGLLIKSIVIFSKKFLFYELIKIIKNLNDINFIELFLFIINSKYYIYFRKLMEKNLNIKLYNLLRFKLNILEKKKFKKKIINFIHFFEKNVNIIFNNF